MVFSQRLKGMLRRTDQVTQFRKREVISGDYRRLAVRDELGDHPAMQWTATKIGGQNSLTSKKRCLIFIRNYCGSQGYNNNFSMAGYSCDSKTGQSSLQRQLDQPAHSLSGFSAQVPQKKFIFDVKQRCLAVGEHHCEMRSGFSVWGKEKINLKQRVTRESQSRLYRPLSAMIPPSADLLRWRCASRDPSR